MMELTVKTTDFLPDPEPIIKRYGLNDDDPLTKKIQKACQSARSIAKPIIGYKKCEVRKVTEDQIFIDDVCFTGKFVTDRLKHCRNVFPFVASCGVEMDQWQRDCQDMMLGYCLEDMRQEAIKPALELLKCELKHVYGLNKPAVINPGSIPQWPVSEQKTLFSLLQSVHEKTGVRLDESMLMYPLKSVSGIYFEDVEDYNNCRICTKENCPSRRVPCDEETMLRMLEL